MSTTKSRPERTLVVEYLTPFLPEKAGIKTIAASIIFLTRK